MEYVKSQLMPDGVAIHYRLWRTNRRPARGVILLLHGMASNLTRWSEFVEHTALKDDWDILRVDMRGHGESFARGRIGADIWGDDLIRLLNAEGYDRAIIIGHSLGAHVAMHFTARFPERVGGLVLIDPAFSQALCGSWRVLRRMRLLLQALALLVRMLNAVGLRRRRFPKRDLRVWDERVRKEFLNAGLARDFVKRYSSSRIDLQYFPTSHYLQELAEMVRPLPEPAQLRVPMLVLLSRSVTYTDPAITQRLIESASHIDQAGIEAYHWPLTEKPVEVRREIENWFGKRLKDG